MMAHTRGGDRLSKLGDGELGHVLSFLPAKEAARAAALSSRWRDVFGAVHTVSLEEPEDPIPDYEDRGCGYPGCDYGRPHDPNPPLPFTAAVNAAIVARHRRPAAAPPLRALRVAMSKYGYGGRVSSLVDQWVSYALKQAAPGFELDLRLRCVPVCSRPYSLRGDGGAIIPEEVNDVAGELESNPRSSLPRWSPQRLSPSISRSPRSSPVRFPDGREDEARGSPSESHSRSISDGKESTSDGDSDSVVGNRRRRSISDAEESNPRLSPPRRSPSQRRRLSRSPNSCSPVRIPDGREEDARGSPWESRSRSISNGDSDSVEGSSRPSILPRWTISDREEFNPRSSPPRRSPSRSRSLSPSPIRRFSPPRLSHSRSPLGVVDGNDVVSVSTDRGDERSPIPLWKLPRPEYTVPRGLFSCAVLRSLRIGPCRLSPPAAVSLPSLEELLLTHVSDEGDDVQRLISACPRLADLTLEACDTVTALSLLDRPFRRLALRCCHKLASVAVDASELQDFEYRGAVPDSPFLTMRGGVGGSRSMTSCKIDICGKEVSSAEELTKMREFLQLFVDTKRLHLQSARLGSGLENDAAFVTFPSFSNLRHLELRGFLPHDDAAIVGAMTRILQHAPSLEVLSMVFLPPHDKDPLPSYFCKVGFLLDAHHLRYNRYDVLAAPSVLIPCLRNRVREINLVHYHGGRAQRRLAKFLLRNAPVIDELWCEVAEGPLWMQTELKREMEGWVMNEKANTTFR